MEHDFKKDVISGFLVFLIALPLCLGISMASGFPPIAGILTAIVGGLVSSLMGSSRLTIKGPAAGLIVIVLAAVQELGQGDPVLGYKRTLAVGVGAAVIQIVLALLKSGVLAELMPPMVVHGMLAAIGVIIISKQSHILLGAHPTSKTPLDLLKEIPNSLENANPEVLLVGMVALLVLFGLPYIKNSWLKKVPAPLAAILVAVPLSVFFNFNKDHDYIFMQHLYHVGPKELLTLPNSLVSAMCFPDFSVFFTITSIKHMIILCLVASIESLLTASAINAIDPEKKPADLNKDLFASGVGNLVSSLIGGLPMISEIVRSKANVDNGAKTYWANVFHGLFLLLFVSLFPELLHQIPMAVLAALLIYTGTRLASPSEFRKAYAIGWDQLLVFSTTVLFTVGIDLLVGVAAGIVLKFLLHLSRGVPVFEALDPKITVQEGSGAGGSTLLSIEGPAIFTNYLTIKRAVIKHLGKSKSVEIDFSKAKVIDHTVQERLHRMHDLGDLTITGLDHHRSVSEHHSSTRTRII